MSNPHIEEAYRLLAGEAYRVNADGSLDKQQHFCSLAADLHRIDRAIGAPGGTPFAAMADVIQAVFVELIAVKQDQQP